MSQVEGTAYIGDRKWAVVFSSVTGAVWDGSLYIIEANKNNILEEHLHRPFPEVSLTCLTHVKSKKQIIVGGMDGEVRVFPEVGSNNKTGDVLSHGHFRALSAVSFSGATNTLVTTGWDKRINRYNMMADGSFKFNSTVVAHYHHINALSWHKEGHYFASGSQDKDLKIWDIRQNNGTKPSQYLSTPSSIFALDWHPQKEVLVVGNQQGIVGYDLRNTETPIFSITSFDSDVKALSFNTSGAPHLAVGADSGETAVFENLANEPKKIFSLKKNDFIRSVSWATENVYLCGGGWARDTRKVLSNLHLCKIK